jgi:hypothetical protein
VRAIFATQDLSGETASHSPPTELDLEKDPIAAHISDIEFRPKALACALVLATTRRPVFFWTSMICDEAIDIA